MAAGLCGVDPNRQTPPKGYRLSKNNIIQSYQPAKIRFNLVIFLPIEHFFMAKQG